uniref:Uncharacterized protein LOC101305474 n=1 Tax=Rhizophora mucronata TaxID=61149 RepID=A0A2P2KT57_RHIMU
MCFSNINLKIMSPAQFMLMFFSCLEIQDSMSDFVSFSAEQQGLKANPIDLSQFIEFVRRNKLQNETFIIGANECK